MSVRVLLFALLSASTLSAQQAMLQPVSLVGVDRAGSTASATMDISAGNLVRSNATSAYTVSPGTTSVIVAVPRIESIANISFVNAGATGRVTVFVSPTKLSPKSNHWQRVASQPLTNGIIESVVRPNEARYIKLTFDVARAGQVSRLAVFARSTIASAANNNYALLATDSAQASVESDGKAVVDGKDLGEAKDIPSEGEAPAEGPPPGLPDPPPFTFVPVLVPTSP